MNKYDWDKLKELRSNQNLLNDLKCAASVGRASGRPLPGSNPHVPGAPGSGGNGAAGGTRGGYASPGQIYSISGTASSPTPVPPPIVTGNMNIQGLTTTQISSLTTAQLNNITPNAGAVNAQWGSVQLELSDVYFPKIDVPPVQHATTNFTTIKIRPNVIATNGFGIQFKSTLLSETELSDLAFGVHTYSVDYIKKTITLNIMVLERNTTSTIKNIIKDGFDEIVLTVLKSTGGIAYTTTFCYAGIDEFTMDHKTCGTDTLMYQMKLHFDSFV